MKLLNRRQLARWRLLRRKTFDLPAILISFSGIFLWVFLPHNIPMVKNIPKLPPPQVIYTGDTSGPRQFIKSPTIFALPSIYGFSVTNNIPDMPDISEYWYKLSPHYLNEEQKMASYNIDSILQIDAVDGVDMFSHIVDINTPPVLGPIKKSARILTVKCKGCLADRGFSIPDKLKKELVTENQSWMAKVFVQIGETGYPEQLFLEKSSKLPKIDAKILKILHYSRIKEPGTPCEGYVIINFGL